MKLITLDNLYDIWFKWNNSIYLDSLSLFEIIEKYSLSKIYTASGAVTYEKLFQFGCFKDLFTDSGWKVI